MNYGKSVFWRETQKPPRFLFFDARTVVVFLLAAVYLRVWTIFLAVAVIFVFTYFERKSISADAILRYARSTLAGRRRPALGIMNERSAVDYGFEADLMASGFRLPEPMKRSGSVPDAGAVKKPGITGMLGFGKSGAPAQTPASGLNLEKAPRAAAPAEADPAPAKVRPGFLARMTGAAGFSRTAAGKGG